MLIHDFFGKAHSIMSVNVDNSDPMIETDWLPLTAYEDIDSSKSYHLPIEILEHDAHATRLASANWF
jgi:hypothetical protein